MEVKESRNLEDFRLNEYLSEYLAIIADGPDAKVEMSYNHYAIHAFYSTMEDIRDLETQATFVNNGRRSGISIALWFLALESFVNCICKISCLKEKTDFDQLRTKSISKRLDYVFQVFHIDGLALKKSGLISKINEFQQFRNEIFHDRNFGEKIEFHKTNFSPIPFFSNQVDVMQALLIFLETSYALRYCIKELDLMANISIGNAEVLIFEKLDKAYRSILCPYFEAALKKQDLKTYLNLDIAAFYQAAPNGNDYFGRGEVLPVFRREQKDEYKHKLSEAKTNIGVEIYNAVVHSYNKPPGHNDSPNFMLDWNKLFLDSREGRL
jgi:hypothetical protein